MRKTDQITISAEDATDMFHFVAGVVYRTTADYPSAYVMPVNTGNFYICDCIACDRQGNPIPGEEYPVPVHHNNLDEPIFED